MHGTLSEEKGTETLEGKGESMESNQALGSSGNPTVHGTFMERGFRQGAAKKKGSGHDNPARGRKIARKAHWA